MTRNHTLNKLLIPGTLALAAIGILLRTLSLFLAFDRDIGYYVAGSALPICTNLFLVLSLVAILAAALFLVRRNSNTWGNGTAETVISKVASLLCSTTFLGYTVFLGVQMKTAATDAVSIPQALSLIASLLGILYFLMNLRRKDPHVQVLIGVGVIGWLTHVLASIYFNIMIQMNAPEKVLLQFAVIALMIFFTAELRAALGMSRPARYYAFTSLALIISGTCSVPFLIGMIGGVFPYAWNDQQAMFRYVIFALFLYVLSRLIAFGYPKEEPTENPNTDETVRTDSDDIPLAEEAETTTEENQ